MYPNSSNSQQTHSNVLHIITSDNVTKIFLEDSDNFGLWRFLFLLFLIVLGAFGFFGNILTLVSLPYVRKKYGAQFSVLQSSTFILLLNLSICDLLYICVGFTHFIHVLISEGNPFLTDPDLCYTVALFRNWAAQADITTMGAIALCVCKHKLCSQCRLVGNPSLHRQHGDVVFGNKGIYVVVVFIWTWSFLSISCEVFGIIGEFKWTNSMYGCDAVYPKNQFGYGMMINIIINLLIILGAYSIIIRRLLVDQKEAKTTMNNTINNIFTKHIWMMVMLSITYVICILPASIFGWGMFDLNKIIKKENRTTFQVLTSIPYWCMYGLNFVLYVTTSERLREAFRIFWKDMFRRPRKKIESETVAWWLELRTLSKSRNKANCNKSVAVKSVTSRTLEDNMLVS